MGTHATETQQQEVGACGKAPPTKRTVKSGAGLGDRVVCAAGPPVAILAVKSDTVVLKHTLSEQGEGAPAPPSRLQHCWGASLQRAVTPRGALLPYHFLRTEVLIERVPCGKISDSTGGGCSRAIDHRHED